MTQAHSSTGSGVGVGAAGAREREPARGLPGLPHFAPKAKRVIYLFQSGGPSQIELFDYKPRLRGVPGHGSARFHAQRPAAHRHVGVAVDASRWCRRNSQFAQHGQSGAWVSELLPHTAKIADQLTFVKSVHTEEINHDPGGHDDADRLPARRAAEHGRVGVVRDRLRDARICRRSA